MLRGQSTLFHVEQRTRIVELPRPSRHELSDELEIPATAWSNLRVPKQKQPPCWLEDAAVPTWQDLPSDRTARTVMTVRAWPDGWLRASSNRSFRTSAVIQAPASHASRRNAAFASSTRPSSA